MSDAAAAMHDKVDAFADGELPPEEAEAFRAHLVDCAQCQAELRDIMMLAAVTQPMAAASTTAASPTTGATTESATSASTGGAVISLASRRRRVFVAVASVAAAAAAMVIVYKATRPEPIVLAQADKRPIEARLSYGAADRWRPYDVERASGPAREEVRVDTLARLEANGDWRGLGDAYLLAGEPARAAEALAKAGESADVESDRAALALQQRDPGAALEHAARALALSPGHAQAAWNRALALHDLGLVHAAADAFDALAHRGDKGWSDEAKSRASTLRAAIARQEASAPPAPSTAEERAAWTAADAAERAAKAALARGDRPEALRLVADADARCLSAHADARCVALEYLRATLEPPADAAKSAAAALERARRSGVDPRDVPRRLYVLMAEQARAQGKVALADAYVDEARALMPAR